MNTDRQTDRHQERESNLPEIDLQIFYEDSEIINIKETKQKTKTKKMKFKAFLIFGFRQTAEVPIHHHIFNWHLCAEANLFQSTKWFLIFHYSQKT